MPRHSLRLSRFLSVPGACPVDAPRPVDNGVGEELGCHARDQGVPPEPQQQRAIFDLSADQMAPHPPL
jgi:hypothetical protein